MMMMMMLIVIMMMLTLIVIANGIKCNSNRYGLPDSINEDNIVTSHTKADVVPYPTKVYYHGIDSNDNDNICLSGYIYIIGGKNTMFQYIAKIDSVTLEVYQKVTLPTSLSIGNHYYHY